MSIIFRLRLKLQSGLDLLCFEKQGGALHAWCSSRLSRVVQKAISMKLSFLCLFLIALPVQSFWNLGECITSHTEVWSERKSSSWVLGTLPGMSCPAAAVKTVNRPLAILSATGLSLASCFWCFGGIITGGQSAVESKKLKIHRRDKGTKQILSWDLKERISEGSSSSAGFKLCKSWCQGESTGAIKW